MDMLTLIMYIQTLAVTFVGSLLFMPIQVGVILTLGSILIAMFVIKIMLAVSLRAFTGERSEDIASAAADIQFYKAVDKATRPKRKRFWRK